MSLSTDNRVQRLNLERLRVSSPSMIQVLTQDVIRQHIERIAPSCIADLFALSEAKLPVALSNDLRGWAMRAEREILDIPDGEPRTIFLGELGELPAADIPATLREAIYSLGTVSQAETAERVEELRQRWSEVPPAPVTIAVPTRPVVQKGAAAAGANGKAARATATPRARAVKTPAALVDPRRAEWIRGDAVTRLGSREYAERGLKESIFVAGIRHRSPFTDLTDEEVKVELRRLERERKLKHTGERWLIR